VTSEDLELIKIYSDRLYYLLKYIFNNKLSEQEENVLNSLALELIYNISTNLYIQ
jgi:hypothetical protein